MDQNKKRQDDYLERFRKYKEGKTLLKSSDNKKSTCISGRSTQQKSTTKSVVCATGTTKLGITKIRSPLRSTNNSVKNRRSTLATSNTESRNKRAPAVVHHPKVLKTKSEQIRTAPLSQHKKIGPILSNLNKLDVDSKKGSVTSYPRFPKTVQTKDRIKTQPSKLEHKKPAPILPNTENLNDGQDKTAWMERYAEWKKKKSGGTDLHKRRHSVTAYIPSGRASVSFRLDLSAKKKTHTAKHDQIHNKPEVQSKDTQKISDRDAESRLSCISVPDHANKTRDSEANKKLVSSRSSAQLTCNKQVVYKVVKSRIDTGLKKKKVPTATLR